MDERQDLPTSSPPPAWNQHSLRGGVLGAVSSLIAMQVVGQYLWAKPLLGLFWLVGGGLVGMLSGALGGMLGQALTRRNGGGFARPLSLGRAAVASTAAAALGGAIGLGLFGLLGTGKDLITAWAVLWAVSWGAVSLWQETWKP